MKKISFSKRLLSMFFCSLLSYVQVNAIEERDGWKDLQTNIRWQFMGQRSGLEVNETCRTLGENWFGMRLPNKFISEKILLDSLTRLVSKSPLKDRFTWFVVEGRGKLAAIWIDDYSFMAKVGKGASDLNDKFCFFSKSALLTPPTKAKAQEACDEYTPYAENYSQGRIGAFWSVFETRNAVLYNADKDLSGLLGGRCAMGKTWWKFYNGSTINCIDYRPLTPVEKNTDLLDTVCFQLDRH